MIFYANARPVVMCVRQVLACLALLTEISLPLAVADQQPSVRVESGTLCDGSQLLPEWTTDKPALPKKRLARRASSQSKDERYVPITHIPLTPEKSAKQGRNVNQVKGNK